MESDNSGKGWCRNEIRSKGDSKVWYLVEFPNGFKTVDCKWVFKTKHNSKGNIERYKARLVTKGFTQKRWH